MQHLKTQAPLIKQSPGLPQLDCRLEQGWFQRFLMEKAARTTRSTQARSTMAIMASGSRWGEESERGRGESGR